MKVKKSELLEILEALRPGLSNKDIIELSDSITFTGENMVTYNDVIAVQFPFESDFTGAIKEERFSKHIAKVTADKEGDIKLGQKKENLVVTSGKRGKTKAGIPMLPGATIDISELGDTVEKWKKLPPDFNDGLRLSMFSAGTDNTKPVLTCIHVKDDIIESSNGHRGFKYKMKKKVKQEFLVPATSIPAILNHPIKKYSVTRNWIHFKTKVGAIISCRMYADVEYPDTAFLYDVDGGEVIFPDALIGVIDNAVVFIGNDEDTRYITIKVKEKQIVVESESIHGWFKEPIKCKSDSVHQFIVNPSFMKDILKTTTTAILDSEKGLLKFTSDKWEHVIEIALG